MTTIESDTSKLLTDQGLSLQITSGPTPHVEGDWPCIAYKVELLCNGKTVLITDYKMGVGHVEPKKARIGSVNLMGLTVDEQKLLETWQSKLCHAAFSNKERWASVAAKLAKQQKVVPSLASVLYSLLSDGEPFFNAESFEDWAANLGYDTDSRKAEATYRACDLIGRQLTQNVPADKLAAVREILANY